HGLGVSEAARSQGRDEQLAGYSLARSPIDDPGSLAREVDEPLLPSPVDVAHGGRELASEAAVVLAELGVAVPVGVIAQVLDPQELQRHPRTAQFLVQTDKIGQGALRWIGGGAGGQQRCSPSRNADV